MLQSRKRIPRNVRRHLLVLLLAGHSCAALAEQVGELQLTGPGHTGQTQEEAAAPQSKSSNETGAENLPLRSSSDKRRAAADFDSASARIAFLPIGTDGWVARNEGDRGGPDSPESESEAVGSGLKAVDPPLLSRIEAQDSDLDAPAYRQKPTFRETSVDGEVSTYRGKTGNAAGPDRVAEPVSDIADRRDTRADVADGDREDGIHADAEESRVVVRDLRIGRDGRPAGQGSASTGASIGEESEALADRTDRRTSTFSADVSLSDRTDAFARDRAAVADGKAASTRGRAVTDERRQRRSASQRVGDMDRSGDSKSEVDAPQQRQLDYAGYPKVPLTVERSVQRLKPAIRTCLRYYYDRPEHAHERSNWGMMHSIMVYGVDTPILVGPKTYSAVAWIAGNNACRGKRLLKRGPEGIEADQGVGLQGHQAQLLAVLSLVGVPAEYPLYAAQRKYSVADLIRAEALACKSGAELTFTLIGLSHYLSTDDAWIAEDGERWDFERLIREELSQPVVGAACGGTHRLMGLAHALRCRRAEGLPITGQWSRAEKFLDDFVEYTYQLQNRDGSMSTNWFEGRQDNGDLDRKVQTTGHVVEWLLTMASDSQLQDPRLVRSIEFLLHAMYSERDHDWSIGPKGHALRSLAMYYERVYDEGAPWRETSVARHSRGTSR